jgi:hypothetical protein
VNDFNPQTGRLSLGVAAMAVVLAATSGASVVDRFLEHGNPQRAITSLIVLWVGTTALVEILVLLIR